MSDILWAYEDGAGGGGSYPGGEFRGPFAYWDTTHTHTQNSDKIIPYENYTAFVNYCLYIYTYTQTHMQSVQELKGTSGCSHVHTYIVRFILYNFTFCCFYGILSILFHSFQIPLSDEESFFFFFLTFKIKVKQHLACFVLFP